MRKFAQGQKVSYQIGNLSGTGKVVGMALTEQPVIGGTYIIEPDEPISNEAYEFSHFVAQEIYLKAL